MNFLFLPIVRCSVSGGTIQVINLLVKSIGKDLHFRQRIFSQNFDKTWNPQGFTINTLDIILVFSEKAVC